MKKLLCVLLFGLMFGQDYPVDNNFIFLDSFNSHQYYLYTSGGNLEDCNGASSETCFGNMNWQAAKSMCQGNGGYFHYGHLVTINSIEENNFITDNIPSGHHIWIGLQGSYPNLNWITGEDLTYDNFSGNMNGDCYEMQNGSGIWDGVDCSEASGYRLFILELEGFDFCLHTGANLVSVPCRDEVEITDAIPPAVSNNLTGIIGEGVAATNDDGIWVGSLNGLGGGSGYWFISDMEGCFNYTCSY